MPKIRIEDGVAFDDGIYRIQDQTPEFQTWFNTNINQLINDKLKTDGIDQYGRPVSWSIYMKSLKKTITVIPVYIYNNPSSWAISTYTIKIV